MSYFDRLKAQNSEKQALKALPKLPKAPYDSFSSSQMAHFSENTMSSSTDTAPATNDRHHCRECRHLSSAGYCNKQRFRPVDDIPRRCEDFSGYPDWIGQSASGMLQTSEAEHNAKGLFFKFLVTRQDGTQVYAAQMPRMTLEEARAQHSYAAAIEPISGEDYKDE